MNAMEDRSTNNDLMTRLAELEQKMAALQAERAPAAEQTHVHQQAMAVEISASPEKALGRKRESRRRLLEKGLGVAAATLGAAALLEVSTGTALANGTEGPTTFVNNGANALPVFAYSSSSSGSIAGLSSGTGYGILGQANSSFGTAGVSNSSFGLLGQSNSSHGLLGSTNSLSSFGVLGVGPGNLASGGAAVGGFSNSTTDNLAVGVYGNGQSGTGVYGTAQGSSGIGVQGVGNNTDGTGVIGSGDTGVMGVSNSNIGSAVFGAGSAAVSGAGYFAGDVQVTGTLTKGIVNFKIDHPQDPANKYLSHSCVESPDIKNVYDGVATLDALGAATVTLPAYFGVLNKDFRYQLTAIGAAGPNLHIATGIINNTFTIAGGTAGMQVSWQVTGIRQDAFALANPVVVEQNKSAKERGRYLHPTLYGHTASESIVTLPNAKKVNRVASVKLPVIPKVPVIPTPGNK